MRTLSSLIFLSFIDALIAATPSHYFVTTFAGSVPPLANPIAARQYIGQPTAVAYDVHGNLYYANQTQVWRLNPDGTDTLIAGKAVVPDGTSSAGNGFATDATFSEISSLAFDQQQNLYIADGAIFKMTPDQKISILLPAKNIYFRFGAYMLATDAAGNLYAAGYAAAQVMKYGSGVQNWTVFAQVDPSDNLLSIATSGSFLYLLGLANPNKVLQVDMQSGNVTTAFQVSPAEDQPEALAVGPDALVYFASPTRIYAGNPQTGAVRRFAGTGVWGYSGDGGPATQAELAVGSYSPIGAPSALAVNPVSGDVASTENYNHVFRVISAATQTIQTVAGAPHFAGDNGPAVLARFDANGNSALPPAALTSDTIGNLYFFDRHNARIRKITPAGTITTIAGNGIAGFSGDGGKATQASIGATSVGGNLAVDKAGNLYFLNSDNFATLRMVDLNGNIRTVAGGGSAAIANGVKATGVQLGYVGCVAVDSSGNLYISQSASLFSSQGEILKIDASGNISVFAGDNNTGFSSPDGTPALQAAIGQIRSLAVDGSGLVYFADANDLIRMVNAQGNLVTIAGSVSNTNYLPLAAGPARSATLSAPRALTFDRAGNLYFTNEALYGPQIAAVDTAGNLTPIAGNSLPSGPRETTTGDGGDALQAGFADINGLALDPAGSVYVLDSGVYIRQLSPFNPSNPPPYLLSGGVIGSGASLPAVQAISPNGDATIYGGNFGPPHTLQPSDLVNGKVPTTLASVCASFGGIPAAMLGVYPGQINIQVPTLPPGPVAVQVTLNCGKPNAVSTNFAAVIMQAASPEFFTFLPDPVAGNNPIAAVNALTGALIGPPGLLAGATFAPVTAGDIVAAYGTGWGATNPALSLGVIPNAAFPLASPYTLTLGGTTIPALNMLYAGAAPCCAGLYQVNFIVPTAIPSGSQPLVITIGGVPSPPHAFIQVR